VAAEPIIEWSAYGNLLTRDGNRSAQAAPQALYACAGDDRWLAVSVASDEQWLALAVAIGRSWAAGREVEAAVEELVAAGIPAAVTRDPRGTASHPQFVARSYHETVDHPVAGRLPIPTLPFRLDGLDRWTRTPAPTFGQHNDEVLGGLLGVPAEELTELRAERVIAERPTGL
jgi:crotonobetainyl-CoA:carnitine CoA-transferase CaiB-like acyl-CoA transferase